MRHILKSADALAWEAGKRRIRAEVNYALGEVREQVLNSALDEWTKQFNAALKRGQRLELTDATEARALVDKAIDARRKLTR